jgi:hypothetical protein
MRRLDELPEELLLQIVSYVASNASIDDRRKDLRDVVLTSKKLQPIGQELLYKTIHPKAQPDEKGSHGKVSTVALLIRTLIERPDLANLVQELNLDVIKRRLVHARCGARWNYALRQCRFDCRCGIIEVTRLAIRFLEAKPYKNELWKKAISKGKEPAFYGLLVALVPSLEHLTIRCIYKQKDLQYVRGAGNRYKPRAVSIYEERHFSGRALFGRNISNVNLGIIPGLANLKSVVSGSLVPPPVFSLPKVQHVEFGLMNWEVYGGFRGMPTCFSLCSLPAVFHTVTALTIHVAVFLLEGDFRVWKKHHPESCYSYLLNLVNRMENLRYLCWNLAKPSFFWSDTTEFSVGYSNLFQPIQNARIQTIVIDGVDLEPAMWDDGTYPTDDYFMHLDPFASAKHFMDLKRIVAPQQAFIYSRDPRQARVPIKGIQDMLPESVESIEIM